MNLLLDTDIGSDVDDALALGLIVGSPELQLRGISTVYGDTRLRAQLASRYLRIAGVKTVPSIAAGLASTRSGRAAWWAGHEGKLFPDLETESVGDDGVGLLVRGTAAAPGALDVLAIGPLTNIAAALDADPKFESNVKRLVIMGGDFRAEGRIAEHNLQSDIAAAQRVFSSNIPIVIGGLDVTFKVRLSHVEVDQIAASGPLGGVLADEIRVWWKFNDLREDLRWNSPHDPILALWLARPDLFTETRSRVKIDDTGLSDAIEDPAGRVRVLDVPDPVMVKDEIVRRIIAASAQTQGAGTR